ncbi:MAG TPA: YbjN domain-containing protein [Sandaracinaceae bacterium LLY-WYZ-13_1]|nr:YbjN domain-containing protein [Sandaracinaceae bacterium LLY-WYZ-13_1]
MRTREDIEAYLSRSGHPHREISEDTWLVSDPSEDRDHVVVRLTEGLAIFRMKVVSLDRVNPERREEFFDLLLRLNAEDMVHGAYGVADGDLVMVATLRLEHLDFTEFSGTLDDFSVALTNHFPRLREFIAEAA